MNSVNKTAALMPIGNEILSGKTLDSNSNWIALRLGEYGVSLQEIRVVPDRADRIIAALNELRQTYDYVITTGGIGPTHDDITSQCVAEAFGVGYGVNDRAVDIMTQHYGDDNLNPGRLKMAMVPDGAELILNEISAAPGFRIENVFVLAGVPEVMRIMMPQVLAAMVPGKPFISRYIDCAFPESKIAQPLSDIQDQFPNLDIGSYPRRVEKGFAVTLVVRSQNESDLDQAEAAIQAMLAEL